METTTTNCLCRPSARGIIVPLKAAESSRMASLENRGYQSESGLQFRQVIAPDLRLANSATHSFSDWRPRCLLPDRSARVSDKADAAGPRAGQFSNGASYTQVVRLHAAGLPGRLDIRPRNGRSRSADARFGESSATTEQDGASHVSHGFARREMATSYWRGNGPAGATANRDQAPCRQAQSEASEAPRRLSLARLQATLAPQSL
jgi:hypothetical protein